METATTRISAMTTHPKWLYDISYGLADNHKFRVLWENERHAVVQIPGGEFANGQVRQYGSTTYYKVDKNFSYRSSIGLLDAERLQEGGRAKLTQWKKQIEADSAKPEEQQ
jgi:hypothetical protein